MKLPATLAIQCAGLLVSAAVFGCSTGDTPVSPSAPPTPAPSVNQAFVGTWAPVGSQDGIEFKNDGTYEFLYVYGNRLHKDPVDIYNSDQGGLFSATSDGKCTFSDRYDIRVKTTCTYAFSQSDSTLTLNFGDSISPNQSVYVRRAIGDPVLPN
jgi:hypothetical protein